MQRQTLKVKCRVCHKSKKVAEVASMGLVQENGSSRWDGICKDCNGGELLEVETG